jgi:predicted nucleotidyltransferase
MRAREGDLIQTENNVVFDVKGLVHPPGKVVAFPRFIPSPTGTRKTRKGLYWKVYNLSERFKYLQENMPNLIVHDPVFDENLCEVQDTSITRYYKPAEGLRKLRFSRKLTELESKALRFAESLKEAAGIPWNAVGISGSVLVGLSTSGSDIDPVVYGTDKARKAYEALEKLLKTRGSGFKPYSDEELRTLFEFRSKDTEMSFEDFARVESRKAFQGKFDSVDYFVRFMKDWREINEEYGDLCYKNSGHSRITATVEDDSEALFTPCTYTLENVKVVEGSILKPISEITSFRGRFCQQARTGETIMAQGKIEHVINKKQNTRHYRMIIGNKPSDYMALSYV